MSYQICDRYIWAVEAYLMKKHGVDAARRMIDPLTWYIGTARASVDFLHKLVDVKPYIIGRILEKGGSHDEVINNIKTRIGAI